MKSIHLGLLLLHCAALLGCGADRPDTVPVSGRITMNGGELPAAGKLHFAPLEAAPGYSMRPGIAEFDTDGHFVAQTWESGDGLTPGKYVISAECWKVAPAMDGSEPKSHLPAKYLSGRTSGWQLDAQPGSSHDDLQLEILTR